MFDLMTSKKGVSKRILVIVLAAVIIVASLGLGTYFLMLPKSTPQTGYVLNVDYTSGFLSLETAEGRTSDEIFWGEQVYDTLVQRKAGTADVFEPALATSWELSSDKLIWTFHLRTSVKFHDGSDFKADSVKWTFDRIMANGTQPKSLLAVVTELRIVDDYTVQLNLSKPYYGLFAYMTSTAVFPIVGISAKQYEVNGDWAHAWLQTHEMGTGPYKFTEVKLSEYLIAEKFQDYWKGWDNTKNNLDKIVSKVLQEPTTRKMMLLTKELDITTQVLPEDIPELLKVDGIEVKTWTFAGMSYLIVNAWDGAPLANISLRKAVVYAFDYDAFINGIWKGYATKAESCLPHGMFGFKPTWSYSRNITKAAELLKEAGYEPGELTLKYIYNIGVPWKESLGELLKDNLADIGINLEIVNVNWPTMVQAMSTPDAPYDLFCYYTTAIVPEATRSFRLLYHSSGLWHGAYNKWPADSVLDGYIEGAEGAATQEDYANYLGQAQQYVSDNVIGIPLIDGQQIMAKWKSVKGYLESPLIDREYNWYDMYKEE